MLPSPYYFLKYLFCFRIRFNRNAFAKCIFLSLMFLLNYLIAALIFYLVALATTTILFALFYPVFFKTWSFTLGDKRAVLVRNYFASLMQGACTLALFLFVLNQLHMKPTFTMLLLPIGVFLFNRYRSLTPTESSQITMAVGLQHDGIDFDSKLHTSMRLAETLGQLSGILGAAWFFKLAMF